MRRDKTKALAPHRPGIRSAACKSEQGLMLFAVFHKPALTVYCTFTRRGCQARIGAIGMEFTRADVIREFNPQNLIDDACLEHWTLNREQLFNAVVGIARHQVYPVNRADQGYY